MKGLSDVERRAAVVWWGSKFNPALTVMVTRFSLFAKEKRAFKKVLA
jgi:hypothetical protein